jgi:cytochrome P450
MAAQDWAELRDQEATMRDCGDADFYTDVSVVTNPHDYFAYLRSKGPITPLARPNALAVTGYDEAIEIMLDTEHFSNANATVGALVKLPFQPEGDDIRAQVEEARAQGAFDDFIATAEGQRHVNLRSLLSQLFTPSRLKALEPDLVGTADALIDEFVSDGKVDVVKQYARPFTTLIIADLLGVPQDDRNLFREYLKDSLPAQIGSTSLDTPDALITKVGIHIYGYLAERRQSPRQDILSDLALARYPDGSEPSLQDLAGLGAFLFGAGQDTTAHLIGNGMRLLATRPELQDALRADAGLIPDFVEEMLRYDGSVMGEGRLCVKTTRIGGSEIKAGTSLLIALMGANHDERRFEDADEFKLGRPRAKEHLAFGRGAHTCIGAPLARSEARLSFERLLARLGNIRLSQAHHGSPGDYRFEYEPTFILRALKNLHLEFDPE